MIIHPSQEPLSATVLKMIKVPLTQSICIEKEYPPDTFKKAENLALTFKLDSLEYALSTPISLPYDPKFQDTDYHNIGCSEVCRSVGPGPSPLLKANSSLLACANRKKLAKANNNLRMWAPLIRPSTFGRLLFADHVIRHLTRSLYFMLEDAYKPIEYYYHIWPNARAYWTRKAKGDAEEGERLAKKRVPDPTGFDKYEPATWTRNTPPCSTGGAADLVLMDRYRSLKYKEREVGLSIKGHSGGDDQDSMDFFEKLAASGVPLTEAEKECLVLRRLVYRVMTGIGFEVDPYDCGAWHYGTQLWALERMRRGEPPKKALYGYVWRPTPRQKMR